MRCSATQLLYFPIRKPSMGNQLNPPRQGILEPDVDPLPSAYFHCLIQGNLEKLLQIQRLTRSHSDGVQRLQLPGLLLGFGAAQLQRPGHPVNRLCQGGKLIRSEEHTSELQSQSN